MWGRTVEGDADMKKYAAVFCLLLTAFSTSYADHGGVAVSFGVFYSSLSPHGEWIAIDGGVYAWRPMRLEVGWRPYTVGHWVWTDDGWYWVSDKPWGWATYHYGRWYYDDFYGWIWIPGYDWAPAWVEWRYGGDYIGWAPLGPYALFSVNLGLFYRTHWVTPYSYWSFIDCRYVTHPYMHRYIYRAANNTSYIGRTRTIGNVRYDGGRIVSRGPEPSYIERRGNVRISRAEVADVDRPQERVVRSGNQERIEVYRPKIEAREGAAERPGRVREADRRVDLDAHAIDIRSRDANQEKSLRRSDDARVPPQLDRRIETKPETKPRAPVERKPEAVGRKQRTVERVPQAPRPDQPIRNDERRGSERRERQVERKPQAVDQAPVNRSDAPARHQEYKDSRRSPNPERTMRRPEPRKEERKSDSEPRGEGRKR
jgi:hypothetical protein